MTKRFTSYVLIIETLQRHPKREVHKVMSSNSYARPAYLVQLLYPIQTLDLLLFRLVSYIIKLIRSSSVFSPAVIPNPNIRVTFI